MADREKFLLRLRQRKVLVKLKPDALAEIILDSVPPTVLRAVISALKIGGHQ